MNQNYKNHTRLVTGYHMVLGTLLLAGLAGSIVNLIKSLSNENLYSASLIFLLFICCTLLYWYVRVFPLKSQDRAIRAEENFRHFILVGKLLPDGLHISQIIALRFASDEEFPNLVQVALKDQLSAQSIKQAIRNWKPDYHRV